MSEKTISEFLKEMAAAGFTFDYRATNGEMTFVGKCIESGNEYIITHRRVQTVAESKAKIKEMLK
jgi:hypothetical protein